MTNSRLAQLLDYAQALKVAAEHYSGNVADTRDIVKALEELQAYQQMWASMKREERAA